MFVAKDVKTRISFTFAYGRLNSKNAKDFLEKLIKAIPFEIKGIQTDNGSEFLGEFSKALKKKDIKHYFNYPRYPKGQAYVERMNRTLQDEFIMYYEDYELKDVYEFNKKMMEYMLWYNIERPHHSLNKKSPIAYFCDIINSRKSEFSQTGMTYT
ncbi:integrase core domain-containing protein [Sulfurihydrogenibium sp. YO3AOP1]|uniref:integrase core domain-containing protein n=1 Tax=Sulfurihydrogenibium sp. (strain YO3AOP1) TaxID=436114 RepID=UPI0024828FB3|nr:integrase core domain-containing protein [Sulfurihydrogenibium sp. YO3AOP1]